MKTNETYLPLEQISVGPFFKSILAEIYFTIYTPGPMVPFKTGSVFNVSQPSMASSSLTILPRTSGILATSIFSIPATSSCRRWDAWRNTPEPLP